jgi:hypothetical protein
MRVRNQSVTMAEINSFVALPFDFIGAKPPNRVVLLQFPDMDAVKAFYDKEGRLEADVGSKYASFRAVGIEGVEQK